MRIIINDCRDLSFLQEMAEALKIKLERNGEEVGGHTTEILTAWNPWLEIVYKKSRSV